MAVFMLAIGGFAADLLVFGPETFERGTGQPVIVTRTFRSAGPTDGYTLRVSNHEVTSGTIALNGRRVVGPDDFGVPSRGSQGGNQSGKATDRDQSEAATLIERSVTLRVGDNQIAVELHGKPGTSVTVEIVRPAPATTDTTPPTITATATPAPNANGWNNSTVTATFTCADTGSGVGVCPAPVIVSAEGAHQAISGTATDKAGNSATSTITLNIDKTPPIVTTSQSPNPNENGWNNGAVIVTFIANDALSGVPPSSVTAPLTVSLDGASQSVTGQATDLAGNTSTTSRTGINIDATQPSIVVDLSPPPNAAGYSNGPVTAHFTCTDALSGIVSCPPDRVIATEGPTQTVVGTTTDNAGNTASVTSVSFGIDVTAPSISVALSPAANSNGWNNSPVTAHFTCVDTGSGVATCPTDKVVSSDGANQTVSGTVTDNAGNTASLTSAPFNVDQTKPTITVALTPAPVGFLAIPVTAHFTCSDELAGVASCPLDQVVSSEGVNQHVTGTVIDAAGNSASVTSDPFSIDSTPPVISVTLQPAPNAKGWNRTPVTAHFTCSDAVSGVGSCPADQIFSSDGINQLAVGVAFDVAGNQATATASINVDMTPPVITLSPPTTGQNGTTVYTPSVTVSGTASDGGSGLAATTCDGVPISLNGGAFSCIAALSPGSNAVDATAIDVAGNEALTSLSFAYIRVPIITVNSPANLSFTGISPTTVTGTVDDPTASVTINSVQAPVSNGTFSVALPLSEGPNLVTATATAGTGASGTASLTVTLDTTPPHVTVTSPPDQFVTTADSLSVAGNVNDIVVGTVNPEQAQVTVNGLSATVANRTFLASVVPLQLGANLLNVVARDRVGNAATTQIAVTRRPPSQTAQIQIVSGNNQSSSVGSTLSDPLVVSVTDALGAPVPNKQVIFEVTQNDGLVTSTGTPAPTGVATTDSQGRARATWVLGKRAGAGGNAVEAYSIGVDGTALFTATGTQGAPGKIVVDTGNDQIGAIGQMLPKPLIAVVVDDGNNRLVGVPVTFTVERGGGSFDGRPTATAVTDPDGRAAAALTLGLQEGNANNLISATFPLNEGFAAAFTASGRAPGNPANTTITGVVLDNSNNPIPGVTVRAVLTNELHSNLAAVQSAISVQTGPQGQFSIAPAPVGFVKLMVDGSTAQMEGTYPALEYDLVTVPGQNSNVGQPIYLLPLNTNNSLCVTATSGGGTLIIPEAPGFSLTFGPGQVTFPGGSKTGCISVTVVNGDKVPMMPGFGQQPRFIVTIQPSGAAFNPPAPISLPNVDGLAPRAVTEMYSFDHDIGSFVAIGTGVVSDDGTVIRSSAGVGVMKAGWHCGGDPKAAGSVADCGPCRICNGTDCDADPSQDGQECAKASGDTGVCAFGSCRNLCSEAIAQFGPVRDQYVTAAESAFNLYKSFLQEGLDELKNVQTGLLDFITKGATCVRDVQAICVGLPPLALTACAVTRPSCIEAATKIDAFATSALAIVKATGDAAAAAASYANAVVDIDLAGAANLPIVLACPSVTFDILTDLTNSIKNSATELVTQFNPLLQSMNDDMATASQLMRTLGGYGFSVP